MTTTSGSDFRTRARHEAERYGADAWVFVRELLQNARDAGAHRVDLEVVSEGGRDRISCRDDGEGMTWSHAREFLFTLYASSKRTGSRSAGRFGIGFWSVLRFLPSSITIGSRVNGGEGWQVRLDSNLDVEGPEPLAMDVGTEIVIERAAWGDDVEGRVRQAVLRDAPFLTRRGRGEDPLEVRVNSDALRRELALPPPSLSFKRRGLRGAVGLGTEPKAEIFVHGLRVREAATLDDLLLTGRRGRRGVPTVAGGLAPQAKIDSGALTVLMARGDAREDRSLRRLVGAGHRELRRLVRAELDRHVQVSAATRLVERLRGLSGSRVAHTVVAATLIALLAAAAWNYLNRPPVAEGPHARQSEPAESGAPPSDGPSPYRDLGRSYPGPRADSLSGPLAVLDLRFEPARHRFHFAGLLISGMGPSGTMIYPSSIPSRPTSCTEDCLEVELRVAPGEEAVRLPVATGFAVVPTSVRWKGESPGVSEFSGGLAVVRLGDRRGGTLTYRCAPQVEGSGSEEGSWPDLPSELTDWAAARGAASPEEHARAAVDFVRRRVRYDISQETARRHLAEERRGRGLFERCLAVGAGDCDVQNAMVAALLAEVGVPARMAVGWVGEAGRVLPGLHAWVEYPGSDHRWHVADASVALGADFSGEPAGPAPPVTGGAPFGGWPALGIGSVVLIFGLWWLLGRGSAERVFKPGDGDDLADLVRAAAGRPGEFSGMEELFSRGLIPVVGGRPISLTRATSESRRNRLAVGRRGSALAEKVAARCPVIDRDTTVGAAVADSLGAVDLDGWQEVLTNSRRESTATAVARALTAAGEPCRIRIAEAVGEDMAVLDGSSFGLPRHERWVVLDSAGETWRSVRRLGVRSPAAAALSLAADLVELLGVPASIRGRCLAGLARAVVAEQLEKRP